MKENLLDRIKLLMEYNLGETYDENKKRIINEGPAEEKIANEINRASKGHTGGGEGTLEEPLTKAIESITSTQQFWDVNSILKSKIHWKGLDIVQTINDEFGNSDATYVQRISNHLKNKLNINNNPNISVFSKPGYKDSYTFKGNFKIVANAPAATTTNTNNSVARQNNINYNYCGQKNGMITADTRYKNTPWESYKKTFTVTDAEIEIAKKSCPNQPVTSGQPTKTGTGTKAGTKTVAAPPEFLKNIEGVKAFQDWLDINKKGWYKGGELNKGGGYGSFGPSTTRAWNTHQNAYIESKNLKKVGSGVERTSSVTPSNIGTPSITARPAPNLQSNVTGDQIYKSLYDNGNLEGAGDNRIKVKSGIPIADESLLKLDQYLSTLGYTRIKQDTEKNYGSKYVWSK